MKAPTVILACYSAVMLQKQFETAWLVMFRPSDHTLVKLDLLSKKNRGGRINAEWSHIEVHQFHGVTKWPGLAKIINAKFDAKNFTFAVRIFNKKSHKNSMEC